MSDTNSMDDLAEELENVMDEFDEEVDNAEFGEDLDDPEGKLYLASQLEDELEGSIAEGNTNVSDYTEGSGSHPSNYEQPREHKTQHKHATKEKKQQPPEPVDTANLNLRRTLARRGIFSADQLDDETLFGSTFKANEHHRSRRYQAPDGNIREFNDPGLDEKHCVLRLPEYAAKLIKERIENEKPLEMTVIPTGRYDYREFKITIGGLDNPLYGILGELPCIIEAHKTLNNDLLFKSADISQLMIAYEKEEAEKVAETLKEKMWEWPDGLTPGTKNIRKKRFKEYDLYTNDEIKEAERETLILMNGLVRDTYHFEIKTSQEVNELVQNYRNGNIKERVIGPDEDVSVYINALEEHETEDMQDLSEVMFDTDLTIPNKFIYDKIRSKVFNK